MTRLALFGLLCGIVLLSAVPATRSMPAGDPETGQRQAQACAACHGADGNSVNPQWPRLAGQHASYLAKQLHDYRSGRRVNAQMNAMVAALTDRNIADLAAWYASRPAAPGAAENHPRLLEIGARVYRAGNADNGVPACIGCHGPRGAGNPAARYPALGGQHTDYSLQQLLAYRNGARDNDPEAVMRIIAARLTEVEMKAVSIYLSGLH